MKPEIYTYTITFLCLQLLQISLSNISLSHSQPPTHTHKILALSVKLSLLFYLSYAYNMQSLSSRSLSHTHYGRFEFFKLHTGQGITYSIGNCRIFYMYHLNLFLFLSLTHAGLCDTLFGVCKTLFGVCNLQISACKFTHCVALWELPLAVMWLFAMWQDYISFLQSQCKLSRWLTAVVLWVLVSRTQPISPVAANVTEYAHSTFVSCHSNAAVTTLILTLPRLL